MKRITAFILALSMVFALAGCTKEGQPQENVSLGDATVSYPSAEMYNYGGGASVPEYSVLPGLENVLNKNQFMAGTDEVGDFYFAFDLSDEAIALIEQNGFAVVDAQSSREYFSVYEKNRYSYVPSFITTDSLLHSYHLMFDYLLKEVERSTLMDCINELSLYMLNASYEQYSQLKGTEFENAALRNVAYFSVAVKLLDDGFELRSEVQALVNAELALIEGHEGISRSPIINFGQSFTEDKDFYEVDYSQFAPRGHYTQGEALERYFRASMWYGQMTFRTAYDDEVRSALLMTSALQTSEGAKNWNTAFSTINFFVGECDDITPLDYTNQLNAIYGSDLGSLSAVTDEAKFEAALDAIAQLPPPQINSVPVFNEEIQPDRDAAITGLRFLGQRFTVDASIFQRLIDRETKDRMLPAALDIPAAFGSDEAYEILQSHEEYLVGQYPTYAENLMNVREYVQGIEDDVWTSNLYWSWMNTLRPLADETSGEGYPFFMQNDAWTRKELNTFLGSWTELKHDTLLYAKQAMSERGGGGGDDVPAPDGRGYAEPNPELYGRMAALAVQTRDGLLAAGLIDDEMATKIQSLGAIAEKLCEISIKELQNEALTESDYFFIENYGAELEHLWTTAKQDEIEAATELSGYFDRESYLYQFPDAVVADVATDPNGFALEEATGFAKTIVVAFLRDGEVVLGRGVVFSHYEFTVPASERMTNTAWHELLNSGQTPEIDYWKTAFIANE